MKTVIIHFLLIGFVSAISISETFETLQPKIGGKPKQFFDRQGPDEYTYGYTNAESFKTERRTADGVVNGVYGFLDPRGFISRVEYIADQNGFRIVSRTRVKLDNQPDIVSTTKPSPSVRTTATTTTTSTTTTATTTSTSTTTTATTATTTAAITRTDPTTAATTTVITTTATTTVTSTSSEPADTTTTYRPVIFIKPGATTTTASTGGRDVPTPASTTPSYVESTTAAAEEIFVPEEIEVDLRDIR